MAKAKQLEFEKVNGWGGARRGAGRPNLSEQVNHMRRPLIRENHPMHITMRLKPLPVSLRSKRMFKAVTRAVALASARGLRINQFSLLRNHLHLIVEVESNEHLARGMRSFGGSLGKFVRRLVGGSGAIFDGRFHVHVLKTPTEVKKALRYVLLNFAQHTKVKPHVDRFSSAPYFSRWSDLGIKLSTPARPSPYPRARSWLGRVGWTRAV